MHKDNSFFRRLLYVSPMPPPPLTLTLFIYFIFLSESVRLFLISVKNAVCFIGVLQPLQKRPLMCKRYIYSSHSQRAFGCFCRYIHTYIETTLKLARDSICPYIYMYIYRESGLVSILYANADRN